MLNIDFRNIYINMFFIFLLMSLPYFFNKFFGISSLSVGVLFFSLISMIFSYNFLTRVHFISFRFLFIILFITLHILLTLILKDSINEKFLISIIGLFIFTLSAYLFSFFLFEINKLVLFKTIKYSFMGLLFLGIFHIIFIGGTRNIFPFSEASHYGLFLGPFSVALYILTINKFFKFFIIAHLITCSILFPSTTIFIYVCLIAILYSRFNIKSICFLLIILLVFYLIILNNEYLNERIFFLSKESSSNLSALVYLQGIEDAYYSVISTNGFGLGFQQLGMQPVSESGLIIQKLLNNDIGLNRQDGGFTAVKVISELGLLGILLVLCYLVKLKKAFNHLQNYLLYRKGDIKLIVSYSFIYTYFVELFIRGIGYFSPGNFFFLVVVFYLFIREKN